MISSTLDLGELTRCRIASPVGMELERLALEGLLQRASLPGLELLDCVRISGGLDLELELEQGQSSSRRHEYTPTSGCIR